MIYLLALAISLALAIIAAPFLLIYVAVFGCWPPNTFPSPPQPLPQQSMTTAEVKVSNNVNPLRRKDEFPVVKTESVLMRRNVSRSAYSSQSTENTCLTSKSAIKYEANSTWNLGGKTSESSRDFTTATSKSNYTTISTSARDAYQEQYFDGYWRTSLSKTHWNENDTTFSSISTQKSTPELVNIYYDPSEGEFRFKYRQRKANPCVTNTQYSTALVHQSPAEMVQQNGFGGDEAEYRYWTFKESDAIKLVPKDNTPKQTYIRKAILFQEGFFSERSDNSSFVIAVDATPTRGGGLFYYPPSNTVHYYAIDWTNVFDFQDLASDKFEMVNALLALEIFKDTLIAYKSAAYSLVLKVDNSFIYNGYRRQRQREYRPIYQELMDNLAALAYDNITAQQSNKSFDYFVQIADKLSHNSSDYAKYLMSLKLGDPEIRRFYDYYTEAALSKVVIRLKSLSRSMFGNDFKFVK